MGRKRQRWTETDEKRDTEMQRTERVPGGF